MTDGPVIASDVFLAASLAGLLLAPIVGASGAWRNARRALHTSASLVFLASFLLLTFSWRQITGGSFAAAAGHGVLLISVVVLTQLGRLVRLGVGDHLLAGLTGLLLVVALTIGPFALGPLTGDLSSGTDYWILLANPLVTVSTAAGIDLLHLDLIYRLSPLAHRGVALPAWPAACGIYAILGLACVGVSRLRQQER